jgi:hypothetical protein
VSKSDWFQPLVLSWRESRRQKRENDSSTRRTFSPMGGLPRCLSGSTRSLFRVGLLELNSIAADLIGVPQSEGNAEAARCRLQTSVYSVETSAEKERQSDEGRH